jgi:trans-aconitate 2-methyltransferase
MVTPTWDPDRYLAFAEERGRPFLDLVGRVGAVRPLRVADLGCGPGNLTRLLAVRWPGAEVVGVDASAEMIRAARTADWAGVRFEVADLRAWAPDEPVDVLVCNATLQWVPGHLALLPRLVAAVAAGGWLAFQVPGNFGEPSHTLLHALAAEPPYAPHLQALAEPAAHDAAVYLTALLDLGCAVDAWETTYLHLLQGEDPVFTWMSGTGARPVLRALPAALRDQFETEYRHRLRTEYPRGPYGTVLPFRRVFAVAQVPG